MTWFTERRLDFIDWCLAHHGYIVRADLTKQFDISVPQASADLKAFMERYPGAIRYDLTAKRYVTSKADYKPRRGAPKVIRWEWPLQ